MNNIVGSTIGLVHLIFSVIALVTGIFVLCTTKGTLQHKRIGYIYAVSMLALNITAFMIYRLFGKFAIFHWFAVVSCITLFAGMYPVLRKTSKNYLLTHFNFMYWSVVGLYAAFMAEIFSRLPRIILTPDGKPMTVFFKFVGIAIGLVMFVAVLFFIKYKPIWKKQYEKK